MTCFRYSFVHWSPHWSVPKHWRYTHTPVFIYTLTDAVSKIANRCLKYTSTRIYLLWNKNPGECGIRFVCVLIWWPLFDVCIEAQTARATTWLRAMGSLKITVVDWMRLTRSAFDRPKRFAQKPFLMSWIPVGGLYLFAVAWEMVESQCVCVCMCLLELLGTGCGAKWLSRFLLW